MLPPNSGWPSSTPHFAVATTQVEFWYAPACNDSLCWNIRCSGPSPGLCEFTDGVL